MSRTSLEICHLTARDKRLLEVYNSKEIAESVFQILGVERCCQIAINRARKEIDWEMANRNDSGTSIASYFQNNTFLELLSLTKPRKTIESLVAKVDKELREFAAKKIDEQKRVSNNRWDELLAVLTPDQRDLVKQRIGQPVEWFRIPKNNTFETGATWLSTNVVFAGTKSMKIPSALQKSSDELNELEIELLDSLVYQMLYASPLWPEFELVQQQENELNGTLKNYFNESALVRPQPKRLHLLLNGQAEYTETVKNLFLPKQLKWFQQIELQIRLEKKYDAVVGLMHPKMTKFLNLDFEQKASIEEIGERYRRTEKNWQIVLEAKTTAMLDFLHFEVHEILNEEQKKVYRTNTGQSLISKAHRN